jgi:hypothetical protein
VTHRVEWHGSRLDNVDDELARRLVRDGFIEAWRVPPALVDDWLAEQTTS